GKAELKPQHQQLLRELNLDFAINMERPGAAVTLIEGYADGVDSERVNASLRQARARAVADFLGHIQARNNVKTDVARAAPAGTYLMSDQQTPHGRGYNRAVKLCLKPIYYTLVVVGSPQPDQPVARQFVNAAECHPLGDTTIWLVE